jgi:hypothetical protein
MSKPAIWRPSGHGAYLKIILIASKKEIEKTSQFFYEIYMEVTHPEQ